MSKRCAVKRCLNGSQGPSLLSFFRASGKYRDLKAWKSFSGNADFSKNSCICEIHFEANQFVNNANRSQGLVRYALPTLHGPMDDCDQQVLTQQSLGDTDTFDDAPLHNINDDLYNPHFVVDDAEEHVAVSDDDNISKEVDVEQSENIVKMDIVSALSMKQKPKPRVHKNLSHDHDYGVNPARAVAMAERILDQEEEILKLKAHVRKCEKQKSKKNMLIKSLRQEIQRLRKSCNLPEHQLQDPLLVEMQQNKNRKSNGARYSDNIKNMSLILHYCSPKAYRQMRNYFRLPSISTIKKWLSRIDIKDGFSTNILKLLKIKANYLTEDEKLVTIFFDEMSITENLVYLANAHPDYFVGFPSKIPGSKKVNIKVRANSALTVMVKTIKTGFKQAIGTFFCKHMDGKQLKRIISQAIADVNDTGFVTKALCCDQNSTNRALLEKEFNVTEEKPYFVLDSTKIFCLYDAPHLLKSIRNNLLKHNAVYKGKICSFDHIKKLYFEDVKTQPRSVPRLKHEHIKLAQFAEMSVGKAANVLSHSVAIGLRSYVSTGKLPQAAIHTSQYCEDFDQLFDIANSSILNETKELKRPIQSHSEHLAVLESMREPLRKMYFIDRNCDSLDSESNFKPLVKQSRKPYCLDGWLLYISAVIELWKELQSTYQFKFLRTRNLQQDCLEHFFSLIRWKNVNNNHPDASQFLSAYKAVVVNQLMVPKKIGNVEADISKCILNSEEIQKIGFVKIHEREARNYFVSIDKEMPGDLPDQNELSSIHWTTGWACGTVAHKCCKDRMTADHANVPASVKFFSEMKKYNSTCKTVSPGDIVFNYFQGICKIFELNFENFLQDSPIGVKQELMDVIEIEFDFPVITDNALTNGAESEPLVLGLMCLSCAYKVTNKYLNMLIGCKLSSMNVTFKIENDEKKKTKRNQKSKRLNIPRYASL